MFETLTPLWNCAATRSLSCDHVQRPFWISTVYICVWHKCRKGNCDRALTCGRILWTATRHLGLANTSRDLYVIGLVCHENKRILNCQLVGFDPRMSCQSTICSTNQSAPTDTRCNLQTLSPSRRTVSPVLVSYSVLLSLVSVKK